MSVDFGSSLGNHGLSASVGHLQKLEIDEALAEVATVLGIQTAVDIGERVVRLHLALLAERIDLGRWFALGQHDVHHVYVEAQLAHDVVR